MCIRDSMCIGNLRSGTENLHHYLHTKERKFLDSSLLYYGIIICFIIGAVIGNAVVRILHEKAILGCSFLLFVAFLIMFIDREKELRENSVSWQGFSLGTQGTYISTWTKTPESSYFYKHGDSGVFFSMRMTGLEPARRRHQNLNLARLPIPPHPLILFYFLLWKKKIEQAIACSDERAGIRTPDNLIKSQVLYHLSYTPLNTHKIYIIIPIT